jgi:hypothetical protein
MKIISNEFNLIYDVNLNNDIKKTNINIKTLTSQEYLILKGFSRNCLDGTDIPEDVKLRLIDKSSDVNVYKEIFKSLFQIENENTKSKND